MRLSVNDFVLVPSSDGGFHYHPGPDLLKTEFYSKKLEEYNRKYPNKLDRVHSLKWLFEISREVVFQYLGWQQNPDKPNHFEGSYGFPFFKNTDQSLLFLTVAIALHNESI